VGRSVGAEVGWRVAVLVASEKVGTLIGVLVLCGVRVGVGVMVGVAVFVGVRVGLGVAEGVIVFVAVGVLVGGAT